MFPTWKVGRCRPPVVRYLNRFLLLLLTLFLLRATAISLASEPNCEEVIEKATESYARGDWNAVVQLIPDSFHNSAELDYLRGMALARLGKRQEARRCLESGSGKAPSDKRFPQELAGLAFQDSRLTEAKGLLFRALTLDPRDAYTLDFLGSVFFMEDNFEAALKYWNSIGKPRIRDIQIEPRPRLKPELLDHVFQFAPASLLRLEELRLTRTSLDQLGVFSNYRFELLPRPGAEFDLAFHPVERNGLGDGLLDTLASMFRAAPAQIFYLEVYNLRARATNWLSLYRWNAQKRRLFSVLSGVWQENPRWGYLGWGDLREENWELARIYQGPSPSLGDLRLQTAKGGFELHHVASEHWDWTGGIELAHRKYRNVPPGVPGAGDLFSNGISLKYRSGSKYRLLSLPEHQLVVWSSTRGEIARQFSRPGFTYARLREDVQARWLPGSNGKDYVFSAAFRAGKGLGSLPFDELAMLGMERENDLPLHGHPASYHGKKGNVYLGKDFLLLNTELDKRVYAHPWFDLLLGPLLDVGKTYDEPGRFASPKWIWDLGLQARVQLRNGSTLSFSYGKSLRDSERVFFVALSK